MTTAWKKVHTYHCPCGYQYDPETGDESAGWGKGMPFAMLPDQLTCPKCQTAKKHFREKKYSVPVKNKN